MDKVMLLAELAALRAENAKLREALKPLAQFALAVDDRWPAGFLTSGARHGDMHLVILAGHEQLGDPYFTLGDCRLAAELLAKPATSPRKCQQCDGEGAYGVPGTPPSARPQCAGRGVIQVPKEGE